MAVYSINDLEKLSGVKAHTLRIWEKRYGIINPKRTDTNIRYYLDEDLQKLLNICLLNRKGIKISKIAKMSPEEIKQNVAEYADVSSEFEDHIDTLMFAMFELDEFKFNKIINHNIDSKGFEKTMEDVVYPLMDKLSMMWVAGSIKSVHENFVANVIKRKTIVAIDTESVDYDPEAPKFLIYLPENESHELSLLYLHYVLKKSGVNVINLGTNVPLVDVIDGQQIVQADYIFTIFNDSFSSEPLQPYLEEMSKYMQSCNILISGYQTVSQPLKLPENVQVLTGIKEVRSFAIEAKTNLS